MQSDPELNFIRATSWLHQGDNLDLRKVTNYSLQAKFGMPFTIELSNHEWIIWPTKPKIFTIWLTKGKFTNASSGQVS